MAPDKLVDVDVETDDKEGSDTEGIRDEAEDEDGGNDERVRAFGSSVMERSCACRLARRKDRRA